MENCVALTGHAEFNQSTCTESTVRRWCRVKEAYYIYDNYCCRKPRPVSYTCTNT